METSGLPGKHHIVECWQCNIELLNDIHFIEKMMVKAAMIAGAELREVTFHQFAPQGISGAVLISESHLTIHTYPENGYAAVDVFTCGERMEPMVAINHITEQLAAKNKDVLLIERGGGQILKAARP
ncbi:adenosylmethionine decarboxylase [Tuberibacillus sp. Marseille-P3662]|uniref:adenosylmethionine decarboxylase n=1 Tax=Tuberibacillus sp. Marseille-P3662 TaxID=1965358 RepID=UPI000A1CA3A4|nr:adenosylmethionine decarboxylase [Tuberibacillus sp. Marseille-P3662]